MFALKVSCVAVLGIPAGFFLEFEPCVGEMVDLMNVEQSVTWRATASSGVPCVGEMVDLMNVEQSVTFLEGHSKFGGAPRTGESMLGVGVMTVVDVLVKSWYVDVLADTRGTQQEREFLTASVRQDGMQRIGGW